MSTIDTTRIRWFAARARDELVIVDIANANGGFIFAANPASFTMRTHDVNPDLFYLMSPNSVVCLNWRLAAFPPLSTSADRGALMGQLLTLSFINIHHRSATGTSALPGPNDAVLALRINITNREIFKNALMTNLTATTTCASSRISIFKDATIAGGVWVPASGVSYVEVNSAPVVTAPPTLLAKDIVFQTEINADFNLNFPITLNNFQNLLFVVDNTGAGVTNFTINWLDNEPFL